MTEQLDIQKISYQCNQCGKKRIAVFPISLKFQIDSRGLGNIVDVHSCKNGMLNGNILYVDSQNSVRSQVPVGEEGDDSFNENNFVEFAIPAPKKAELTSAIIKAPRNFKAFYLKSLSIKDRLRRLNFELEKGQNSEKKFSVISKMKFIEISADFLIKLKESEVKDWLQIIADLLECVPQLTDTVLTYLVQFLEEKIANKPTEEDKKSLDLLLSSPLTLSITNQKSINIFHDQKEDSFSNLPQADFLCYNSILESSLDNYSKTLLVLYDKLCHKMELSNFLWSIYDLTSKALLKLFKLEFKDLQ